MKVLACRSRLTLDELDTGDCELGSKLKVLIFCSFFLLIGNRPRWKLGAHRDFGEVRMLEHFCGPCEVASKLKLLTEATVGRVGWKVTFFILRGRILKPPGLSFSS